RGPGRRRDRLRPRPRRARDARGGQRPARRRPAPAPEGHGVRRVDRERPGGAARRRAHGRPSRARPPRPPRRGRGPIAEADVTMLKPGTPVMDGLVDFVLGLELASLPPAVIEAAGRSITDWVGTAIRGSKEPLVQPISNVIAVTGGEPQATVIGRRLRTSALLASMANGAQSHALDFDDTHLPSVVDGSAPVAPVVLAVGEWQRVTGADALAAFIAGFEVETRIGRVIGARLTERGWHATATLGHFGAAAAAGRLLRRGRGQARDS